MTSAELQNKIRTPIFFDYEVSRHFPKESKSSINVQLSRMSNRGEIQNIKKGVYIFSNRKVDPFVIANLLYKPSYISLETALNYYGIIPDVPSTITSITTITTKNFSNDYGKFSYSKIKRKLFDPFALIRVGDVNSIFYFDIACAEKALLDFAYLRRINDLDAQRIDLPSAIEENIINPRILKELSVKFPSWVRKVIDGPNLF